MSFELELQKEDNLKLAVLPSHLAASATPEEDGTRVFVPLPCRPPRLLWVRSNEKVQVHKKGTHFMLQRKYNHILMKSRGTLLLCMPKVPPFRAARPRYLGGGRLGGWAQDGEKSMAASLTSGEKGKRRKNMGRPKNTQK